MPADAKVHAVSAVCRLCLNVIPNAELLTLSIFSPASPQTQSCSITISDIIKQHFGSIQFPTSPPNSNPITRDNGHSDARSSTRVCQQCWHVTDQFHQLYTVVRQNESDLQRLVVAESQTKHGTVELKFDFQTTDVKAEGLDEANDEDAEVDLSISFADEVVKVESNDADDNVGASPSLIITHLDDEGADENDDVVSDDQSTTAVVRRSSGRSKVPRSTKAERKKRSPMKRLASRSPDITAIDDEEIPKKPPKRRTAAENLAQDQRLHEFFRMQCDQCDERFRVLQDAVVHYRQQHGCAGYITCCGRRFFNRSLVQDHIELHSDPDAFRCEPCGRSYISGSALRVHQLTHVDARLKKHRCVVCAALFPKKFQLEQHQRQMHAVNAAKSRECDICGKL